MQVLPHEVLPQHYTRCKSICWVGTFHDLYTSHNLTDELLRQDMHIDCWQTSEHETLILDMLYQHSADKDQSPEEYDYIGLSETFDNLEGHHHENQTCYFTNFYGPMFTAHTKGLSCSKSCEDVIR